MWLRQGAPAQGFLKHFDALASCGGFAEGISDDASATAARWMISAERDRLLDLSDAEAWGQASLVREKMIPFRALARRRLPRNR